MNRDEIVDNVIILWRLLSDKLPSYLISEDIGFQIRW